MHMKKYINYLLFIMKCISVNYKGFCVPFIANLNVYLLNLKRC
jgi:hypothetical protein